MQRVDLVAPLGLLVEQLRDEGELGGNLVAKRASDNVIQVAAQVPHDPAGVTFQLLQCLAHAAELLGVGIAAHLYGQTGRQAGIALAQIHPGLLR